MIEAACQKCGKLYIVKLNKVKKGQSATITCIRCGHVSQVVKPGTAIPQSVEASPQETASNRIALTNSLKIRVNALIILLVVIVMGGYAGFSFYSEKSAMETELQYSADIIAKRLSKRLVEPLWALDDGVLKEALASEMLNKQLFAINTIDKHGEAFYFVGKIRDPNWNAIDIQSQTSISNEYTTRRMDIIRGGEKIGAVEIYLTDKFLKLDFKRSMTTIAIIVAILIIAISLSMSIIIQKMVIHPITELTALADGISMGDLESEIPTESENEIGLLAQSINRLKNSLQISMRSLETSQ